MQKQLTTKLLPAFTKKTTSCIFGKVLNTFLHADIFKPMECEGETFTLPYPKTKAKKKALYNRVDSVKKFSIAFFSRIGGVF